MDRGPMRIFHVLLMTVATIWTLLWPCVPGPALAQSNSAFGGGKPHVSAILEAESNSPKAGGTTTLAFRMTPDPGWHGYWSNPGDAGLGMSVQWSLPEGATVGELRYPVPQTLVIAGLMNHVYEGPYAILVTVKLPVNATPGTQMPIVAKANWLACTDKICVPQSGEMRTVLTVGDGKIESAARQRFDGYRAALPRPLGAQAHFSNANGKLRIAIPYPAAAPASDVHLFALEQGALRYAAQQKIGRAGDLMILETDAATGSPAPKTVAGVLKVGEHQGFLIEAVPGAVPAMPEGGATGDATGFSTIMIALGAALLGGLILNIMPCVFPILSLKAMSLARAGGDPAAVRREAVAYAVGVVATCLALGGALLALRAGGAAIGWAFQLQDPRVILILLLLVTGIALNMAGLFELRSIGAGGGLAAKGGTAGAFWTGALVAFVATPCTGPFMGAALGAALVLPLPAALAIFAGLGLGLALPFLLIGLIPALRARMPKPGAWMGRMQRILSVPMFLTALALAWLLGRQAGVNGMAMGLAVALVGGLLLWWMGARQHRGLGAGVPAVLLALVAIGGVVALPKAGAVGAAGGGAAAMAGVSDAVPFSEDKLAALRAQGKPVFLYFTADWCLTCKVNEGAAIERAEVHDAFAKAGVVTMVGDWTNSDPAIGHFLEAQGRSGVPLYLWYAPGKEAVTLPQVLTPGVLTGLVG